ncbi:MAG: hypothetical protein KME45_17440 [Stenomitos rutilans HA7619-LM2]|jgi:hypothetical protein|nr:hypothetical protein [Stenomitos rutilans HA7619-LM2]
MSRDVPVAAVDEGYVQSAPPQDVQAQDVQAVTMPFGQGVLAEANNPLTGELADADGIFDHVSQLKTKAKIALIRRLLTQLEADQIQTVLEFGLREIGDRHRRGIAAEQHNTRLLLKKDYSYQDRGLEEPTQYYVYLRRRKPKLDRYIGTLFYVPQGCTLDYFLDLDGRMVFKPPHNVFQLQDCTNPAVHQVVRLLCLEPPPPSYTFDKQQHDTPAIQLHLEYLDPKTYQPIAKQTYPFPSCMHEGGRLDRYRWDVTPLLLPEIAVQPSSLEQSSLEPSLIEPSPLLEPLPANRLIDSSQSLTDLSLPSLPGHAAALLDEFNPGAIAAQVWSDVQPTLSQLDAVTAQTPRRVLELPTTRWVTFYLSKRQDSDATLKRMRLWAAWSEKAMPQSRWELVQDGTTHTLMNAHFKRRILRFSSDRGSVAFENSLPVLVRWFHDLGLAVSQAQNQRQYSAAQLQLAHSLFVDMSLPQTDPIVVLKKLFGVEFAKAAPDKR